jgi:hypothetical protein
MCVAARFIAPSNPSISRPGAINRAATHGEIFPILGVKLHHRALRIIDPVVFLQRILTLYNREKGNVSNIATRNPFGARENTRRRSSTIR